jgi:hypothetical protein
MTAAQSANGVKKDEFAFLSDVIIFVFVMVIKLKSGAGDKREGFFARWARAPARANLLPPSQF